MNLKKLIIIMSIGIVCIIGIVAIIVNLNIEPVKILVTDITKELGYDIAKEYYNFSDKNQDKYFSIENTLAAYNLLLSGDKNVVLASLPSKEILRKFKSEGVEIETYPVAKDALVFMNSIVSPVTNLKNEDIKKIYAKIFTNWGEVGGNNLDIIAYQTKSDGMLYYTLKNFLGEYDLEAPKIRLKDESLEGLINALTKYLDTRKAALGYTNFININNKEINDQIRILKMDNIEPTVTTICSDEYPGTFDLYLIVRKDSLKNSQVRKLVEYIQSEKGQNFIRESGYINVGN